MLFVADLDNLKWIVVGELDYHSSNIAIGFSRGGQVPVIFEDFSFGYSVYHNDNEILSNRFPPPGITYRSSDEEAMVIDVLNNILPEETYTFNLWAKESGNEITSSFDLLSPRQPQPFASWTYDTNIKMWIAPTSPPADGNKYEWDEDSFSWRIV